MLEIKVTLEIPGLSDSLNNLAEAIRGKGSVTTAQIPMQTATQPEAAPAVNPTPTVATPATSGVPTVNTPPAPPANVPPVTAVQSSPAPTSSPSNTKTYTLEELSNAGAALQETIRVVCKEVPAVPMPENGWPTAGCLTDVGGQWSVAWRVYDAQFWGVPQRRRRIALVADFGGLTASEILFERKGMSGYYPQGRTPWERSSRSPEKCVRDSSTTGLAFCIQGNCYD